jgi:two-component system, cell cycle response regulator
MSSVVDELGGGGSKPVLAATVPEPAVDEWADEVTSIGRLPSAPESLKTEPKPRNLATLTVVAGPRVGAIFTLVDEETFIGRSGGCAIQIDDPGVSRRHAKIIRQSLVTCAVQDLESRNGTFVNGRQVASARLSEGDRLGVGDTIVLRFAFADEAEERHLRGLYESTVTDGLTGVFNRKHFNERLKAEIAYAKRHGTPLSLLMLDLDHFKKVNDTFGHLAGDQVLKMVTAAVKKTLRVEDIFARYGGEEFTIIARGADVAHTLPLAERVRSIVEKAKIEYDGISIPVTISIGIASLACCTRGGSVEELVSVADRRLYACKAAGRNRYVSEG